ncbi:unnamed protein product [Amoebophrya sp. A25]|nr:unnamed protein product [Amoebophrya sp. A25]|eukprot:GSA25T00005418001.1
MGSGVGGPMRSIARFSVASITAASLNAYQVGRCKKLTEKAGLNHLCRCEQGDYTNLTELVGTGSMDAAYAIESLCHQTPRHPVLAEAFRVRERGGLFSRTTGVSPRFLRSGMRRTYESNVGSNMVMACRISSATPN